MGSLLKIGMGFVVDGGRELPENQVLFGEFPEKQVLRLRRASLRMTGMSIEKQIPFAFAPGGNRHTKETAFGNAKSCV
jgi:hypothetical protein